MPTNAPPHIIAVARHAGVELHIEDWQTFGYDLPLLVNLQPAGKYLGESFFRAGGVPGRVAPGVVRRIGTPCGTDCGR